MTEHSQAGGTRHLVRQGECLASIAVTYGFRDFETILSHPENAQLKELRTNPHILKPGDVLFVPARTEGTVECPTGQRHRFQLTANPIFLKLRLRDPDGNAVAGRKYRLVVDGVTIDGSTDDNGRLVQRISPTAEHGKLFLWENNDDSGPAILLALDIGHLDPIEVPSGVQARLRNLGYRCPAGAVDEATRSAVRKFQRDHGLEETGEPDEATQRKLVEVHEFE